MSDTVLVALITGGLTFLGVLVTNFSSNKKLVNDIKLEVTRNQAITDTKIEELTREVRLHNNFAQRVPIVENEIKHLEEEMKNYHKG